MGRLPLTVGLFGILLLSSSWLAAIQPPAQPKPAEVQADDEALRKANIAPDDGPALVAYLKQRTISDAEQGKVKELIKKFSADHFDERVAASRELEKFGPAAVAPLKAAERDPDPEVAYRAGVTLKRLEQIPHTAVAAAAIRRVIRLKPPGAAEALIGFLPLADGEQQADQIRQALNELAAPGGKPEPALVAALSDPSPVRRGAAYIALIEGGQSTERIRIPASFPQVRDAIRKDTDADARFRGLWSLVVTAREKDAVPDLIVMIPQLSRNRLRQVEELLLHVAGQHPAGGRFGQSAEATAKARDVWTEWWKAKGGAVDLVKFPFTPKIAGVTEIVERDNFAQGRVVCLGTDMKEKWRLPQVGMISDARVLPTGRVLVAEQNYTRLMEWNPITGEQSNPRQVQSQAISGIPLSGGGLLIICRASIIEFDKGGARVFEYARPNNNDIIGGGRLANGDTIVIVYQQQPNTPNCIRLDSKGKEIGKPIVLGPIQEAHAIDVVSEDRILVCEPDQVAEYELKTGKLAWKYKCDRPTSVQRQFNGNTLVACSSANRAIEVDPEGEVVWEYTAKDQLRVYRIYHR